MMNRRNFLKTTAFISALPTLNLFSSDIPPKELEKVRIINFTGYSVCPFCSIGCHTTIQKQDFENKITIKEITGNQSSSLNNGELCPKISNLLFENTPNSPRIENPLLKMKDGKYDKNGTLTSISWEMAFDIMEKKTKSSIIKNGIDGVGLVSSERLSIYESYAISKLFKAGFRSNNISNIHCEVENNSLSLIQNFGIDGSNCTFDDIFEADFLVSYGINFNDDFAIIKTKLEKQKNKKGDNFTFFNIITDNQQKIEQADMNFLIKPNSEIILISFLIHNIVSLITKDDYDFLQNEVIFAFIDKEVQINDDKFLQWEVSYNTYKKHFDKFTLDYVINELKTDEEDLSLFKFKLSILTLAYTDKTKKTLSYLDSKNDSQFMNINLLLQSLHLFSNKFAKAGCGVMNLHSSTITSTSSVPTGNSSSRLPLGMFIKYKQHRDKAEAIWNLPNNTLNSVASNDAISVFKKWKDGATNFLWIMGCAYDELVSYLPYLNATINNNDNFIVYSSAYFDDFLLYADLILPTTTIFEKHIGFENSQREITLSKQQIEPYGESMSELWQILEFSKKFTLSDFWGNAKITSTLGLKNILKEVQAFNYNTETTLFVVLFHNNKAKRYKLTTEDFFDTHYFNTEVKGDSRQLFGYDGKLFDGYKFFIQKYLFEEIRLFGFGNGYDLASFDVYSSNFYQKWPIIFNKETKYRFSIVDDIYANRLSKKDEQYIFYGKLGGKKLPFGDEKSITNSNSKELKNRAKIFMVKEAKWKSL